MPLDPAPLQATTDPNAPRSGGWTGLSGLSIVQREQLAETIVPRVIEHLERWLETARSEWEGGRAWGKAAQNTLLWANDFRMFEKRVLRDFEDALTEDFRNNEYPPQYEFSGVVFADQDDGLAILDDYQSTRRSLRHQLEGSLRDNNRYSHYVFKRAAQENYRFEHPNWAPWSPLHWYERLIEIAELYFGKTEMTLDLMRSYIDCVQKTSAPTLAFVVKAIEHSGLITESGAVPDEASANLRKSASWKRFASPGADDAGKDSDASSGHAAPGWQPATRSADKDAAPRMPDTNADPEQWAAWASGMARSAVLHDAIHGASSTSADPGTAGNAEAPHTRFVVPAEEPDPKSALMPFILDLLQGLFDHIFREVGFNPAVRTLIAEMQYPLATAVIRDLSFFRDRSHPLRLWIGSLVNVGIRINPQTHPDSEEVERYLHCIRESVEQLRNRADRLDRDTAEVLKNHFLERVEAEDARWHARQIKQIDLPNEEEWAEQARRNLALAALESDAELPATAAEEIFKSWETVLAVEHNAGAAGAALHAVVRQVIGHICNRASAGEVNPLVARAREHARAAGLADDRIADLVRHLGQAHLQRLRAPEDAERFEPHTRLQARESVRYDDDDPALEQDRDDDYVFAAIGLDVGDWFEFSDAARGTPQRMALIWRGDATRRYLFLSVDGVYARRHSLQGVAEELRQGRMRALPEDDPLDTLIDAASGRAGAA